MSMKVLIADPDWQFCQQSANYLESHAHHVVQQTIGDQISAIAEDWQPDVLILSEELTESGLLEEIAAMSNRPAVLLVGWMDRYDRLWKAWQSGGDELLIKPLLRTDELHAAIVQALENRIAGSREHALAASA